MRKPFHALLVAALAATSAVLVPFHSAQADLAGQHPDLGLRVDQMMRVIGEQMSTIKHFVTSEELRLLDRASEAVAVSDSGCEAVLALREARVALSRTKPGEQSPVDPTTAAVALADVDAALANTEVAVLSTMPAAECGGVTDPQNRVPSVQVLNQSINGFDVRISLPLAQFEPVAAETVTGDQFRGLRLSVGDAGQFSPSFGAPSLPAVQVPFAIPNNAIASVRTLSSETVMMPAVMLAPAQDQPADATEKDPFADPPFQYDPQQYVSSQMSPSVRASARSYGDMRGLKLAHLRAYAGRYLASTGSVEVLRTTVLRVTFTPSVQGAVMKFPNLTGGFERLAQSQMTMLVNQASLRLPTNLLTVPAMQPRGEELLIITSPTLKAQALDYAAFERGRGYVTRVATVGDAAVGSTNLSIQAYIRSHLNDRSGAIRPSYVILFGDTDQVPTFLVTTPWNPTAFDGLIATDRPYSTSSNTDVVPDLAVGRFPVSDVTTATALVAKLKAYITTPTTDSDYYATATITSYFQPPVDANNAVTSWTRDSRGFTKMAETVASFLETSAGKSVKRLYSASPSANPTTYYDGTAMPSSMQRPAQSWTVASTVLRDEINTGRFLTVHRDHGAPTAVDNPSLTSADFSSISNSAEPTVLWFIDCAAGKFDDPEILSIAETAIRDDAGAIAVIAASRNSPSFTNNHFGLGMADAVWPSLMGSWGSGTAITTLGDVLIAGKNYMASRSGSDNATAATVAAEWDLYNLLGDPTFPIRKFRPPTVTLTTVSWLNAGSLRVTATPRTDVTLTDGNGNALARKITGADGTVDITVPATIAGTRVIVAVGNASTVPTKLGSLSLSSRPAS